MEFEHKDYEIIQELGSGGGGLVFLARHLRLNKKVVIKVDKRKITTKTDLLRREVDILKNLSHTYIPHVYDFFAYDDRICTVIDYIEGESLDKPLKRGETFSQAQVIKWAIELLEALSYLHQPIHGDPPKGYVHSDIKPANIMRTPTNDICLIDFNIALAIGESNVVGSSAGYASPEHYGIDYSSGAAERKALLSSRERRLRGKEDNSTIIETSSSDSTEDKTVAETYEEKINSQSVSDKGSISSSRMKKVIPDVRSDIYSVGATLYHLLSGKRPHKDALQVQALSEDRFSPLIVGIINKAMNANPDLRYQTADEMLQDFLNLRINDPRVKKLKKKLRVSVACGLLLMVGGAVTSVIGAKRMQMKEEWYKLAEYSKDALYQGNPENAIQLAKQAFPDLNWPLNQPYIPEAQKALTDALGWYNLEDKYNAYSVIELPAEPYTVKLSPTGEWLACIYPYELSVFDVATGEQIAQEKAFHSALDEIEFVSDTRFVYSGSEGATVYDIANKSNIWTGYPATAIAVSTESQRIVAINRDDTGAYVYDAISGRVTNEIDFSGRRQDVVANDIFINPNNNILDIDSTGTKVAVSFSDGSLEIFDLIDKDNNIVIFEPGSGYSHFEGGFYKDFLAFSVSNEKESVFAAIDVNKVTQVGSFPVDDNVYGVQINESGVCVQINNLLNRLDITNGNRTPLITIREPLHRFRNTEENTVVSTADHIYWYGKDAQLVDEMEIQHSADFLEMQGDYTVIASMNSPVIRIVKHTTHDDRNFAYYANTYAHSEARVAADCSSIILFSYKGFRTCKKSGDVIVEVEFPDSMNVYDVQFRRKQNGSYLEVTYNGGTMVTYDISNGIVVDSVSDAITREDLQEEYVTDQYRIISPLHGAPEVYDKNSNRKVKELDSEDYLTYVTQIDEERIVAQYFNTDGFYYGQLLNEKLEVIADLPYLCDVWDAKLYFDYPSGNIRISDIYTLEKLLNK